MVNTIICMSMTSKTPSACSQNQSNNQPSTTDHNSLEKFSDCAQANV